jgi:hypothetical protein
LCSDARNFTDHPLYIFPDKSYSLGASARLQIFRKDRESSRRECRNVCMPVSTSLIACMRGLFVGPGPWLGGGVSAGPGGSIPDVGPRMPPSAPESVPPIIVCGMLAKTQR